jgi:hypothetical protein
VTLINNTIATSSQRMRRAAHSQLRVRFPKGDEAVQRIMQTRGSNERSRQESLRPYLGGPTFLRYPKIMKRSIRDIPKKRGRPKTTGRGEGILVRLHKHQIDALEHWMASLVPAPSRPEAIRRLVEIGLSGTQPTRQRSRKSASKALNLAGEQIDKLIDPSTPEDERQTRKRRLLKGPQEFRDLLSKSKR